jgi:hypothetical protein
MGLCQRLEWPADFQQLTADRAAKGFTVVQIVAGLYPDMPAFDSRGANEAGFPLEKNYGHINPAYFDMADLRIQHLVSRGLAPRIVGCWGYFLHFMGVAQPDQKDPQSERLASSRETYPKPSELTEQATTIEAHHVVPTRHDRQAIRSFPVAAAEPNRHRTVGVLLRGNVVERISITIVFMKVPVSAVNADRPEAIDAHVPHVELIDRRPIVLVGRDVQINGVLVGIEAPARRGDDQVSDWIDLTPATGRAAPIRDGLA